VQKVTESTAPAQPIEGRWSRFGVLALIKALLISVTYVGYYVWRAATFPYPLDYGEGPLLEQAVRLGQGLPIYRVPGAEPPWTVGNYPPLFPLLNGGLSLVFGPGY